MTRTERRAIRRNRLFTSVRPTPAQMRMDASRNTATMEAEAHEAQRIKRSEAAKRGAATRAAKRAAAQ